MRRYHRQTTQKSLCGDVAIRGNSAQIAQRYEQLALEAAGVEDHVLEQTYLQHAEHWRRTHELEKG